MSVEQTTEPGSALAAPAVRFFWENRIFRTHLLIFCRFMVVRSVLAALAVDIFLSKDLFKKAIPLHCNFNPGDSLPIQVQFSGLEEGDSRNGILLGWPLRKVRNSQIQLKKS